VSCVALRHLGTRVLHQTENTTAWSYSLGLYNLGLQLEATAWDYSLRLQLGTTAWDYSLGLQLGTTAWDYSLGLQLEATAWDYSLGLQLGTTARGCSLGLGADDPSALQACFCVVWGWKCTLL